MGRIRTVKPEFWAHEELSALPEATHMLAAALLNYADDYGYFNANPILVQAACCPLRNPSVVVPESLRSLSAIGYIELGTDDKGHTFGRISNFSTHQKVSHPTESKIAKRTITWGAPEPLAKSSGANPEPLRPEQGTGNREQGREQGTREDAPDGALPPEPPRAEPLESASLEEPDDLEIPLALERSDAAEAIRRWNLMAERAGFSHVQRITPTRRRLLAGRLKELGGLDGWDAALEKIAASSMLRGERNGPDHQGWRADIKFILKQENMTKLMEGGYADRPDSKPGSMAAAFEQLYAEAAEADAR